MRRYKSILLYIFVITAVFAMDFAADAAVLQNSLISAVFDSKGLTQIMDIASGQAIGFSNVSSSITVDGTKIDTSALTPAGVVTTSNAVTYTYYVGARQLKVIYELKPEWRFVSVRMYLAIPAGVTSRINAVTSFSANVTNAIYSVIQGQDPQAAYTGTTFMRFSTGGTSPQENGYGMFALVQNPYVTWSRSGQSISMSYTPDMDWKSTYGQFPTDCCCIGPYALSGTRFPAKMALEYVYTPTELVKNGFDWSEIDAVRQCMRAFMLVNPQKSTRIHVLWCEGTHMFYDAATAEGRLGYKRAIDRAKEFGCDYVLYIATNSAVSTNSPTENADAWQAEYCLWFSMGQQFRKGLWDPLTGPIDVSIQDILDYAASKNVKLVSYVYPSMPYKQNPEWINSTGWADTGVRSFQDWFVTQMTNFYNRTGAGGYCFDHWWIDMSGTGVTSKYAQFFGCRRMLETARQQMPDAVFDGRQTYCWYGPWSWLAGTYPHPLNDDEGSGSWRSMSDLHVDRCYAARHRYKWFWHVVDQFAPIELAPGFITHAGSRSATENGMPNLHDWDYMGWKYSLLSTVGTAPFNLVVNYIPVLDDAEYQALSQADKNWFNYWMDWAENHLDYMRNARPIISQIMIGKVDGSAAFIGDHGYIFLYNSNYRKISGDFKLDKSIGLNSGSRFIIRQLEPQAGKLIGKPGTGVWSYGDSVSIPLQGTSAMVFEVVPADSITVPTLLNMQGNVVLRGGSLQVSDAVGEVGASEDFVVALPIGVNVSSVSVNGHSVAFRRIGDTVVGKVKFDGAAFGNDQQIGFYDATFKGTTYRGSFRIPTRIVNQLQNRRASIPVTFTAADMYAAWTAPYRNLIFIHIADAYPTMVVSAKIDGVAVTVNKGYNGSYAPAGDYMFQGYYLDVSNVAPEVSHTVEVTLPSTLAAGQFQGLFFDNIEPEYTSEVADNQLPSSALVDLDASDLPMGAISSWNNDGLIGGSFGKDSTNPQVQFVAGRKCVTFSGSDRMKSTFLSPTTIAANGKYTVSVWAYNPSIGTEECMLSWAHRGGATGTNAQFNYGSSSTSGAVSHTNTADLGFDGGVPAAGKWHHISVTFDGAVERVYVDGVLNAQEAKTLSMFNTDYLYLGCANSGTAPTLNFSGSIASVQVFDSALSTDDVAALAMNHESMDIVEAKKLPDGSPVSLFAKPVSCAPRDLMDVRTTAYFYIEESDRSAGIRVQDWQAPQDLVRAGSCVSISGVMRTDQASGERYIELNAPAYSEAGLPVQPVFVSSKAISQDRNIIAELIKTSGIVREISTDGKWFTISDSNVLGGNEVRTKIVIERVADVSRLKPGDRVEVIGAVGLDAYGRIVVAQSISF